MIQGKDGEKLRLLDSAITASGLKVLFAGQQVSFKVEDSPNGRYVSAVEPIGLSPY